MSDTPPPVLAYSSPVPSDPPVAVFRQGNLVVARHGATFPARCVLCGGEGVARFSIAYSSPLEISLRLRSVKPRVTAYVCAEHARTRRMWQILVAVFLVCSVGAFYGAGVVVSGGAGGQSGTKVLAMSVLVFGGAVLLALGLLKALDLTSLLKSSRRDATFVYFKGASAAFLESLPDVAAVDGGGTRGS